MVHKNNTRSVLLSRHHDSFNYTRQVKLVIVGCRGYMTSDIKSNEDIEAIMNKISPLMDSNIKELINIEKEMKYVNDEIFKRLNWNVG